MAKLSAAQKTFIVQRLACFESPSDVAEAVKEHFGIELTRQRVQQYDPTKVAGAALSAKLKTLFEETRERFITDTSEIAIAHKSVRLRRLERMLDKLEKAGNFGMAAQLLEQAAKECGDQFTNLRRVAPTDPTGEKPYEGYRQCSDEELDARIKELQEKVGGS